MCTHSRLVFLCVIPSRTPLQPPSTTTLSSVLSLLPTSIFLSAEHRAIPQCCYSVLLLHTPPSLPRVHLSFCSESILFQTMQVFLVPLLSTLHFLLILCVLSRSLPLTAIVFLLSISISQENMSSAPKDLSFTFVEAGICLE